MNDRAATQTWDVTTQQQVTDQDATGRYVPGVRVTFRTSGGINGQVFVPDAQYNPDTVRALITERVAALVSVQNLSG